MKRTGHAIQQQRRFEVWVDKKAVFDVPRFGMVLSRYEEDEDLISRPDVTTAVRTRKLEQIL